VDNIIFKPTGLNEIGERLPRYGHVGSGGSDFLVER
jgi:hypothetical protein